MTVEEYRRLREKGKEHLNEGNSIKAVEYYSRALKVAHRLLELAPNHYSALFSPQEVRATCSNLPDHDPKTCEFCSKYLELAVCYSNRSYAHCNLKEYEGALLDSEQAIKLAPEWPKVNMETCQFYFISLLLPASRDIIGRQKHSWEWNSTKYQNYSMNK